MTVANSVWVAVALLQQEHPSAQDFSVQDIVDKATRQGLVEGYRPGLQVHVSKHCVANKTPNPGRHRLLFETTRGRRRLFRSVDPFNSARREGKVRPEKNELPLEYQHLVDWYDTIYCAQTRVTSSELPGTKQPQPKTASAAASAGQTVLGTAFVGPAGAFMIPRPLQKEMGIREGTRLSISREGDRMIIEPISEDLISRLRGCCKGGESMVEAREREHRDDKY